MVYIRGGQLDDLLVVTLARTNNPFNTIRLPDLMASHFCPFKYSISVSYASAFFREYFKSLFTVSLMFISTKAGVIPQSLQL
jgi:hypothetical protein